MADMDVDPPAAADAGKKKEGKKRFEVKKVCFPSTLDCELRRLSTEEPRWTGTNGTRPA